MKKICLMLLAVILPMLANAAQHTVTYSKTGEGTFTVKYKDGYYMKDFESGTEFEEGTSIQIYAKAPSGKSILSLLVNGEDVKGSLKSGYYTTTLGTEDMEIVCNFEQEEVKYSVSGEVDGEGGSLDLKWLNNSWEAFESGTEFKEGTYLQVHPSAFTGYKLKSLTKNGNDITDQLTANGYYNCQVENENLLFVASFESDVEVITHNVKFTIEGDGTITDLATFFAKEPLTLDENNTVVVNDNEIITLTINPGEGKRLASLIFNGSEYAHRIGDGGYPTESTEWMTPYIVKDLEISLVFDEVPVIQKHAVSYEAVGNGEITVEYYGNIWTDHQSGDELEEGTNLKVRFVPANDYELAKLEMNGEIVPEETFYDENNYHTTVGTTDMHFVATFQPISSGINSVNDDAKANEIYDLTGRRISSASHGVYVVNGKKYIK